MLRRLGGLVVITAACVVLGVTAAVNSLTVSGTATLPAGAIVPGTCIGPVGSPFEHPVSPGAGEGEQLWETATYAYPEPTVVDCRRSHAGQVISVDHGVDAPSAGTMPQFDDLDAACQQQVDALMAARGLSQIVDRRVSGTIAWKPVLDVQGRTVGPDRRARSVGERWSACAEVSSTGALGAAEDSLPGACLDSDDPAALAAFGTDDFADVGVSCSVPHTVQVLAVAAMVGGSPSSGDAENSCLAAATGFTGLSGPDFDGRLSLEVVGAAYPFCVVRTTGADRLAGSLLGLGGAPVPWVG
jgi:hypothetical protein